ncbi:serine/threonine-protein phosphatase 2A 55 kDa regulatory subunit B delta isoform [Hyposmocoma kahamanoa]|uniref:serine/threonine-protein phosphatase 2A 55 kDa regulatory subunit B delta isoform n=1 Tax=Hyposmocoma kahamanoa TaxID=1477025 RepID=UPI000E6D9EED|nr:serine/threonine-protein phosphatase 2A 55 kDa regulatory subunit B delta isoform [Hyposmocoma kahamanoa]
MATTTMVVSPLATQSSPKNKRRLFAEARQNSLQKLSIIFDHGLKNSNGGETTWCFSQVKGTLEDDVTEADLISCVEFNHDGELLATGDKGGRVVIFQRDPASKQCVPKKGEYNVYSTFQSHEPEFDYLKSLEIEEKINKIRWLKRKNQAHFLLSTNDKTIKLWKVSERDKRVTGYNTREEGGRPRDPSRITQLRVPTVRPAELMVEASPSSNCNSAGTIRLCDMRAAALCDRHAKLFEEPEDPHARSFFSEIISSISDVKLSNSGRYMMSRDYLGLKVWDLRMETKPVETYPVHEYLRSKLCSLYENDCIFDKFECCWSGDDQRLMTGSYNGFFRLFERGTGGARRGELTLEASRDAAARPRQPLRARRVATTAKRKKDEISVDCLDFNKKILHTAWHPHESIIAVAATNNLFIFQDKF